MAGGDNLTRVQSANLEIASWQNFDSRIDPLLTAGASATRNSYLASLGEGTTGEGYTNKGLAEFVYDVEYFANSDSWLPTTKDRHYMHFVEFSYALQTASPGLSELNALQQAISTDIALLLDTMGLSAPYARMDVVNVSANGNGNKIYAHVGIGINLDPCQKKGDCPGWLEELALDYEYGGGGPTTVQCTLPQDEIFNVDFFLNSCPDADDPRGQGVVNYAINYVNQAIFDQGIWKPAACNPVDPAIYSPLGPDNPPNNITSEFYTTEDREQAMLSPLNASCFGSNGLYSFKPSESRCSTATLNCVPKTEAHYLMQGGISAAISEIQTGAWGKPAGTYFVCAPKYNAQPNTCGGCPEDLGGALFVWWSNF